jgi:hypothetical protein
VACLDTDASGRFTAGRSFRGVAAEYMRYRGTVDTGVQCRQCDFGTRAFPPPPWSLRSEPTPTPTLLAMCAACPCDAKDGAAPDAAGHGGRNGRGGNATGEAREGGAHVYRTYNNTLIR